MLVVVVVVLWLPDCFCWNQFGGDRQHRFRQDARSHVTTGVPKWTIDYTGQVFVRNANPIIATSKKMIIFPLNLYQGFIVSYSYSSDGIGSQLWTYSFTCCSNDLVYSSAAISPDESIVYAGGGLGLFVALDSATGAVLWQYKNPQIYPAYWGIYGSPAVTSTGDKVCYCATEGYLICLTSAGRRLFRFDLGADSYIRCYVTPVFNLDESVVVVASDVHHSSAQVAYVFAVDLNSGDEVWRFQTVGTVFASLSLSNSGDAFFVACRDGYVYRLDAATGLPVWMTGVNSDITTTPAVLSSGDIIVGTNQQSNPSYVHRLNASTGEVLWSFLAGGDVFSPAAVDGNNHIYFSSSDTYVYCLDEWGLLQWRFKTEVGGNRNSIAIDDDMVIALGYNKSFYIF